MSVSDTIGSGYPRRMRTADVPLPPSDRRNRIARLAQSGQLAMTFGLLAFGAASYVFLAASGRALGPARFASVSVLWAVLYLVGGGLFVPLEQELGRSVAARRATGLGYGALVRKVARIGCSAFVVVAIGLAMARGIVADELFRGDDQFVVLLGVGIAGVGLMFFVRGLLAGADRYHGFGALFLADSLTKSIPAIGLALAGVTNPLAYGLVLATSSFVGALVPMTRGAQLGEPGPEPPSRALVTSLGFLLLTSFLSAVVVNIGTIAVEVLATPSERDEAGVFLSGLVIARIPLFLFQAVQAVVLPRLSGFAASGQMAEFRRTLRMLAAGLAGATVVATSASALLGPFFVAALFGESFDLLGARDMAMLTLASMLVMCALTVNQAQIALHHQRQTGWPWAVACTAFVVVTAISSPDLFLRVELGMVASGSAATILGVLLLRPALRDPDEHREQTPAL